MDEPKISMEGINYLSLIFSGKEEATLFSELFDSISILGNMADGVYGFGGSKSYWDKCLTVTDVLVANFANLQTYAANYSHDKTFVSYFNDLSSFVAFNMISGIYSAIKLNQTHKARYLENLARAYDKNGTSKSWIDSIINKANNNSSTCFVCNAVYYDSDEAYKILSFRDFRDDKLMKSALGRSFVDWYYQNGPLLASKVKRNSFLQKTVKVFFDLIYKVIA